MLVLDVLPRIQSNATTTPRLKKKRRRASLRMMLIMIKNPLLSVSKLRSLVMIIIIRVFLMKLVSEFLRSVRRVVVKRYLVLPCFLGVIMVTIPRQVKILPLIIILLLLT